MYVDFFGLRELPFNNTPDPRFFYSTPDHEEALASLIYAVQSRKGFVLLTGEVGAGKTLVSRLMLRRFGTQIAFANINHSVQSAHDLMEALCTEFELPLPKSSTHAQLVRVLHDYLLAQFAQNIPVVLILDEAQNLPDEAFEQLRMIGNLEADDAKLLQICIVGQPELKTRFAAPKLRQLRQRLYRTFHLPALDRKSTEEYMRHRVAVSGGNLKDLFTSDAVDTVAELSRGLPRLINTICDNAMLSAYAADQHVIDGNFIRTVSAQMMLVETDGDGRIDKSTDPAADGMTQRRSIASVHRQEQAPLNSARSASTRAPDANRGAEATPRHARSIAAPRTGSRSQVRGIIGASDGTQSILSVIRTELARLRADVSREMVLTTQRVEALDRRLSERARVTNAPPRPDRDLSPVLIRAAAILERTATARRTSQRRGKESAREAIKPGEHPDTSAEQPIAPDPNSDLDRTVVAPTAADVATIVNNLDADARTADSLLRAWRTRLARRSSADDSTRAVPASS